jgi:hypothetical protein
MTRLPDSAHTSRPWRIHEIARGMTVEDVWALPAHGGPDDFPLLIEGFTSGEPGEDNPALVRLLWAVRWKLGEIFGWDEEKEGVGSRVPTLRDRLPADLRDTPMPSFDRAPFTPVYLTHDEFAAEIANATVHGVMHLSWVPDDAGGYRGQMAVLVRPNGLFGRLYMAAIKPFRHLLVYPALMRQVATAWAERQPVA